MLAVKIIVGVIILVIIISCFCAAINKIKAKKLEFFEQTDS